MSISLLAKRLTVGVIALGVVTIAAQAEDSKASPCKGLAQDACTANAGCSWVSAAKRKDGREVRAYCRAKAKRSASASSASK